MEGGSLPPVPVEAYQVLGGSPPGADPQPFTSSNEGLSGFLKSINPWEQRDKLPESGSNAGPHVSGVVAKAPGVSGESGLDSHYLQRRCTVLCCQTPPGKSQSSMTRELTRMEAS